jgi:hypothetical protein
MKPRSQRTARDKGLSALVNGLTAPMTNLRALTQTLVSGRVTGRMARDYALMCATEASRLILVVETFVMNDLQTNRKPTKNPSNFYATSARELDGQRTAFPRVRTSRDGMSPRNGAVKSARVRSSKR